MSLFCHYLFLPNSIFVINDISYSLSYWFHLFHNVNAYLIYSSRSSFVIPKTLCKCSTASSLYNFTSARLVQIDFVELLYTWNFQINFLFFLCKILNSGLTRNAYNL